MFSERIKTIASLLDKNSEVLDVGTDHAYLPIYLMQNKLVTVADGSDISEKVLKNAKKNVEKHSLSKEINLYLSDGLKNIENNYDTLVITGMGYYTIKNILDTTNIPDKIIIQSNSEHENLRKYMQKLGYKIDQEITMIDKNKYYVIIKYIKGIEKLSKTELLFGKSNNKNYFKYILNKYYKIYPNLPLLKKIKYAKYIRKLKKLSK